MYFIMMCGLPASGKSIIAKDLSKKYNAKIYSSDALRQELFGDEDCQEENDKLFRELHKRIKTDLANGLSVIYDACCINYKRRKAFLQEIRKYEPRKICYLTAKGYEACISDNKQRERSIPDYVIKRMLMNFWIPQYYEGWDEIKVIRSNTNYKWEFLMEHAKYDDFNQENEHHQLALGEHMRKTADYLHENYEIGYSDDLIMAAYFHDMGKPFTKTFTKKDGTTDGNAHYYNHHNVGAYEFLVKSMEFEPFPDRTLYICNLIQWHMRPYDIEKNGGKEKFIGLVGQEFYDELIKLHEADKIAH